MGKPSGVAKVLHGTRVGKEAPFLAAIDRQTGEERATHELKLGKTFWTVSVLESAWVVR